jgi:hypothetical protein
MLRKPTAAAPTPQGSRDFYARAKHAPSPGRASGMLAVRTRQLTAEDFHLLDLQPCRPLPGLAPAALTDLSRRTLILVDRLRRSCGQQLLALSPWAPRHARDTMGTRRRESPRSTIANTAIAQAPPARRNDQEHGVHEIASMKTRDDHCVPGVGLTPHVARCETKRGGPQWPRERSQCLNPGTHSGRDGLRCSQQVLAAKVAEWGARSEPVHHGSCGGVCQGGQ